MTARIPLRGRSGIVGYALVDSRDMPFAMPDPLLASHLDAVSTTPTSIRSPGTDEEIAA